MTLELESGSGAFQIGVAGFAGPTRAPYFRRTRPLPAHPYSRGIFGGSPGPCGRNGGRSGAHATYIDSAGLGVLVSAQNRLVARGGNLVICSPTPRSMKSFEIAGLSSYLNIVA